MLVPVISASASSRLAFGERHLHARPEELYAIHKGFRDTKDGK